MTINFKPGVRAVSIALLAIAGTFLTCAAPAGAAAAPDACAVVSKSDAAQALGTPILKSDQKAAGPSRNCTMRGAGFFKSVVITTFRWDSIPEAQSAFHMMIAQTAAVMKPSIALHGVGDEAQQLGANVYVRKGDAAYVFNVIDGSVGASKSNKALNLAKKSMAHIK